MARLQDFQTVTPSASDNLLIVQSTGQGLASVGSTLGIKADKSNLTSISITGSTNNTGAIIPRATFFYLNGNLVRAISAIAVGATLTQNTNYVVITAGALNDFVPVASALTSQHANFTGGSYSLTRSGKIVVFSFYRAITGSIAGNVEIAQLPSGFIPYADTMLYANGVYNGNTLVGSVTASADGKIYASYGSGNLTSALMIIGTYICQ